MTTAHDAAAPGDEPGAADCAPTPASPSDERLAERASAGDRAAFATLVERYDERLYRFALAHLRNPDDAAEVTQQTLLSAWRSIRSYDSRRRFVTWVLSIAHRECVNVIRHRARARRDAARQVELDNYRGNGGAPETGVWALAHRLLDRVSYEALWLRYVEDRTPREVARIMGRTSVGVRVLLHRARLRLGEVLDAEGGSR